MATIVGIHGIANTFKGSATLTDDWFKAISDGLEEVGGPILQRSDIVVVAYGALFRPDPNGKERPSRSAAANLDAPRMEGDWESELLTEWWTAAAELSKENRTSGDAEEGEDPYIQPPEFEGRLRAPQTAQRALLELAKSRFFRSVGPAILISGLRQVRLFLQDSAYKTAILDRVARQITQETKAVIGHSLGSVIAYEALCAHPEWNIETLVTLGSPLGIPNVVFNALTPKQENGRGIWPNVQRWVNIADKGDLVALNKRLSPLFGPVEDILVHNGWRSHDISRYLVAEETGRVIAGILSQDLAR